MALYDPFAVLLLETYRKSYEVRRTICSRAQHDGHVPGLSVLANAWNTLVLAHTNRTS